MRPHFRHGRDATLGDKRTHRGLQISSMTVPVGSRRSLDGSHSPEVTRWSGTDTVFIDDADGRPELRLCHRLVPYDGETSESTVKNFPHQYNDLHKLRATLETARDLDERHENSNDDAVLGYALARRRIYGFRGLDYTANEATVANRIAKRIEQEQDKPAGTQGARTAAREMRRTLRYLGWLDEDGTELTPTGETLLATTEGSDEELILMQQAIASIAVSDRDGRVSHPVQILLRLLDEIEFDSRSGMELALEATDDSVAEFRRVGVLAGLPEDERIARLKSLGWTESQLANATKILPAFALQSGLITADGAGRFILTDAGRRATGRVSVRVDGAKKAARRAVRARRRPTSVSTRNPREVAQHRRMMGSERRALTPEEQALAAELLYERTQRHQVLVRTIAEACRSGDFHEDAAAYDLLVDLDGSAPLVLIEVKTIVGDATLQVRGAVGQLLYYEYFAVAEGFPGRAVQRLVVVDERVSDELGSFLETNAIGLIGYVEGAFEPLNERGRQTADVLFRSGSASS